jgi:four helix bundle protein
MKPQDLKLRTKAFALRIIRMYSKLPKSGTVAQVLGKQVLRSGTSVGANYREASRARSKLNSFPRLATASRKLMKPNIGSN